MDKTAELIIDSKAIAGEGPFWDTELHVLYWVDILGKKIHIYDPDKNQDKYIQTTDYVSSVIPRKSGGAIIALKKELCFLDLETGEVLSIHNPEPDLENTRFNDGKCDAAGRLWIGTMDMNEERPDGSLYCLDTDLKLKRVIKGVTISNGLAWSADNKIMYFIDTPTKKISAFDFDLASGEIHNRRTVIDFPEKEGVPDGMSIDTDGMLWIAHFYGGKISRWDPRTGKMLEQYLIPASNVTSCCFGGIGLDELYITTARVLLSDRELIQQPFAGGIFRIKTNTTGVKSYKFNG